MSAPRVLIVDDNAMNVELVSFILAADSMIVASAGNASEALAQVAAHRPDLILMDIQLPDMDGLKLTRRLKADPQTRNIVILALTAYAMRGDEDKMRAAGCDGYVAKPVDVATFAAKVRSFLETTAP